MHDLPSLLNAVYAAAATPQISYMIIYVCKQRAHIIKYMSVATFFNF